MIANNSHPFLDPLWRRVALVVFCFAWAGFEFYNGNQTWGWITCAIAAYAVWAFLLTYKMSADKPSSTDNTSGSDD